MAERACYNCGHIMQETPSDITAGWGEYEFKIKGIKVLKCTECGETAYRPEDVKMMQELGKAFSNYPDKPEYLNLEETAHILRVSNQTVYNMIKDGRIKAYKIGREWRFLASDLFAAGQTSSCSDSIRMAAKGGRIDREDLNEIREEMDAK